MSPNILAWNVSKAANHTEYLEQSISWISFHEHVLVRSNIRAEIWSNENTAKENICGNPGGSSFENLMLDIKVESINETLHEEVLLSNYSKYQNR